MVARQSFSLFFRQKITGQKQFVFKRTFLRIPASKSRKIRIVAGRRFWRYLLVNQLPLSIMAVHAQYRATVPLMCAT